MLQKNKISNILKILLVFIMFFLYFFVRSFQNFIKQIFFILMLDDFEIIKGYISSNHGIYMSFFLMIFQAIVPKVPFVDIVVANNVLYGTLLGYVVSLFGITMGAMVVFTISKVYFKPLFYKRIKKTKVFFETNGYVIVILLIFLPLVPFNIATYFLGITDIKYTDMISGTLVSQAFMLPIYIRNYGMLDFEINPILYLSFTVITIISLIYLFKSCNKAK